MQATRKLILRGEVRAFDKHRNDWNIDPQRPLQLAPNEIGLVVEAIRGPSRTDHGYAYVAAAQRGLEMLDEIDARGDVVDISIDFFFAENGPQIVVDPPRDRQRVLAPIVDEDRHEAALYQRDAQLGIRKRHDSPFPEAVEPGTAIRLVPYRRSPRGTWA